MREKVGKKYLIFGIVCLLVAAIGITFQVKAEKPLETLDPTLKQITFSDYGWDDDSYSDMDDMRTKYEYEESLEGKVISGDVKFSANTAYLYIGGGDLGIWSGLYLNSGQQDGSLVLGFGETEYPMKPSVAGTTLVDNMFNLKLSYQVVDADSDGTKDTLKLGVWFNDKLYNNEYIELSTYGNDRTYKDYLTGGIGVFAPPCIGGTGVIEIASDIPTVEILDSNLQKISFTDYGWNDDSYSNMDDILTKYEYEETLDGKVFSGDVAFSTEYASIYVGGADLGIWNGLYLASGQSDGSLKFGFGGKEYTLNPIIAEAPLVNETFNLKLSYQTIDTDGDEVKDCLKLGVWINNKLYNNKYFMLTKYGNNRTYNDYLTGGLGIYAPPSIEGTGVIEITSDIPKGEVLDASLKQIDFIDYGWQDGTYNNMSDILVKYGYEETLDGKVINGDVTFSTEYASIYVGGAELGIWNGLYLASGEEDGSLKFGFGGEEYTLEPAIAGTTLVNQSFNLKLSYQTVDTDNDEVKDSLKLGVWINNKLYNNKYFMLTKHGNNRTYNDYLTGGLGIYAPPCIGGTGSLTLLSEEVQILPTNYEYITPFDFGIIYNTYSGLDIDEENWGVFNTKNPLEDMNEVLFETGITLGEATQLRYMRTVSDEYSGIEMKMQEDGTIYVINHLTTSGLIWVNGVAIDTVNDGFFIYPSVAIEGVTSFIEQPFHLALTTKFIAYDEDGQINDLQLGIWFNEELYAQQYIYIKDCIDVCTQGLFLYGEGTGSISLESAKVLETRETNERYNLSDGPYLISGTGKIFVNGVEYENGDTLTDVGNYRIVSDNGTFIRNVELYDNGEKNTSITYEDKVMPIVGFYGPHSSQNIDYVTEEIYQSLKDVGINLINYIPKDWSVRDNQTELIQNLIYAEKHGIGIYILDSSLRKNNLTAVDIAKRIAPYSQYASFKGILVADEPATESYYPEWELQLDSFAPQAEAINEYCNLIGYINLFPYTSYYGDYGNYIDEYVSKTNAKLLSYDNYVFTSMRQADYFINLRIAREKALGHGIPFWTYIQAGNWRNHPDLPSGTPTQGQFMWNVNTSLAYGAKGIQYYPLIQPYSEEYTYLDYGILNQAGNATEWYDYAKKMNSYITAIDDVLLEAESKNVLAIGTKAQTDTGISATSYGKLLSVSLSDTREGALIGAFEYQGNEAFYVVNYDMKEEETVTLKFKQSCKYSTTQRAQERYAEGNVCKLTIPAGEAVLVVLNKEMNLEMKQYAEITESISMNYVVQMPNQELIPTMSFEMENGNVLENVEGILVEGTTDTYKFSYPNVMAQDMAKTITASLKVGTYTKVYEYSVLDYCIEVLNARSLSASDGTPYSAEKIAVTKDLVVDLVQYGSAVQTYRGEKDSELLTVKLEQAVANYLSYDLADDQASALATLTIVSEKLTGTPSESYKWKNVALVLENKVKVRARFIAEDISNLTIKATINGQTQAIEYKQDTQAGVYVLDFDNIYAYEFAETITFQFYEGGELVGQTLNYSVNTYLNAKKDYAGENAENLKALLLAIHIYGKAANAYQAISN